MREENKYELYCNGELEGVYTTTELSKRFNLSKTTIREYARTNHKHNSIYEWKEKYFERTIHIDKKTMELLREWDKITKPYRKK